MNPETTTQILTAVTVLGILYYVRGAAIKANKAELAAHAFPIGEEYALMMERKRLEDLARGIMQTDGEARS